MFSGFNREIRNSLRLLGARLKYSPGQVEIAAEQSGAVVSTDTDIKISPRGGGILRTTRGIEIDTKYGNHGKLYIGGGPRFNRPGLASEIHLFLYGAWGVLIGLQDGANEAGSLLFSGAGIQLGEYMSPPGSKYTFDLAAPHTDRTPNSFALGAAPARPSAAVNIVGGSLVLYAGAGASASAGAAHGGAVNIAGGIGYGTGAAGNVNLAYTGSAACGEIKAWARLTMDAPLVLKSYTVATLPSAAANPHAIAVVTDATSITYRGALTGGGSTKGLVYSDGSSWMGH